MLYRDPKQGIVGGVCAGIAESLDVDALLVRVAAIVATLLSFGIAIVLYLVLWTVLPVKPVEGAIIDIEPQRVSSERYARVVHEKHASSDQAGDDRERDDPVEAGQRNSSLRDLMIASRKGLAAYRFPFALFVLFAFAITLVIIAITRTSGVEGFVTLLPLYLIPLGVFLAAIPHSSHSMAVRVCITLLFFEMSMVCLPFTMGVVGYEDMGLLEGSTFLTWIVALIFLVAAIIFENTLCYLFTVMLVFMAFTVSCYDFGFFDSVAFISNFRG